MAQRLLAAEPMDDFFRFTSRAAAALAPAICLALLVAATPSRPAWGAEALAATGSDAVESQFAAFCKSWMEKVSARQSDNQGHISWHAAGGGVEGDYIGYGPARRCEVKRNTPSGVPVGKLVYYEFRYRKQGPSAEAAAVKPPEVEDTTEVTEIFRYADGKWVY